MYSRPRRRLFVASRGAFYVRNPLPGSISEFLICPQASAPLRDFSIPQARSARPDFKQRSLPLRVARSSFAPRRARNNHSSPARRIIVPDPLLPARLAVLRTSWNHVHDASSLLWGQAKNGAVMQLSSENISLFINNLGTCDSGLLVDKTAVAQTVLTFPATVPHGIRCKIIPVSVAAHKCWASGPARIRERATAL